MTGRIQFDKSRRRVRFKLDVVQYFTGKFTKVGFWETGQSVIRTQSDTEMKVELEKSLQLKKLIVASRIVSCVIHSHLHASTALRDTYTNSRFLSRGKGRLITTNVLVVVSKTEAVPVNELQAEDM